MEAGPLPDSSGIDCVSILGPSVSEPPWWGRSKMYYSHILSDQRDSVHVWIPPDDGQVTPETPGAVRLRLEVSSTGMRALDGSAHEHGRIDRKFPKVCYTMHRDGNLIWKLSARSLVRRRHAVEFASPDKWLFHTPFYWWMNILGVRNGEIKVLGRVGPSKWIWHLYIDPECDNLDLLSLLALMHRNWWRS